MTSHSELISAALTWCACVCRCMPVCVCVSVCVYQWRHTWVFVSSLWHVCLSVSVGARVSHATGTCCVVRRAWGRPMPSTFGPCKKKTTRLYSLTRAAWNLAIQGKELNWNLSFTEWPLSVLCWRDYSRRAVQPGRRWTIFSVSPPPPPPTHTKQQQQQQNNNPALVGLSNFNSRLINPINHFPAFDFPAASFRLEVTSRPHHAYLPGRTGTAASQVQHVTSCVCNNARQSSVTGPARHSASTTMAPTVQCHPSSTSLLFNLRRLWVLSVV